MLTHSKLFAITAQIFHVMLNRDTRAYAFVTNASYNQCPKKVHQVYLMLIVGRFQFTSIKHSSSYSISPLILIYVQKQ